MTHPEQPLEPTRVELNGTNVIAEDERKGTPGDLFWPWTAASISVLGIAFGAYILGQGVSWWQAVLAAAVGVVGSGLIAGLIAIGGKRGSAPTLVLSRAAFGVTGNKLPAGLSWILSVGWETILTSSAALATATVFRELGWGGGDVTTAVALVLVVALIIGGGVLGFDAVMRIQTFITWVGAILTVLYIVLVLDHVDVDAVTAIPAGGVEAFVGAVVLAMTLTGLGWVNAAADYSRYLPRTSSSAGVAGWTTAGLSVAPFVLIVFGVLLTASDDALATLVVNDPVGALAALLPTWFLIPFVVVAVLGLASGALLDIYSSGLSLLSLGLPVTRPVAAAIDGAIMVVGSVLVLFVADDFQTQFTAFLTTIGVPIAAWAGVMLADVLMRKRDYDELALFDPTGVYGAFRWPALGSVVVGTAVGWGLIINPNAGWLDWEGYLLGPLGGKEGLWAYASVGVVVALLIGFLGYLLLERRAVRRQEEPVA
jgi:purine-cytosine permease-like protein